MNFHPYYSNSISDFGEFYNRYYSFHPQFYPQFHPVANPFYPPIINSYYGNPYFYGNRYNPPPLDPYSYIDYSHFYSTPDVRQDCESARINATMDYVYHNFKDQGFNGGMPNFHQAIKNGELVHGTVIFRGDSVVGGDISKAEFGNIDRKDVGEMMRAANNIAIRKNYAAGIPTFHIGPDVYGMVWFKPGTAEIKDVLASDLGNPPDIGSRFRAVNDYALNHGYAAAFPNFHQALKDGQLVYGVVFINRGSAEIRDVSANALNLPKYIKDFGCDATQPEFVTITKTIASFDYPHTPINWRKYRIYLEVEVPREIASSMQDHLDRCMDRAVDSIKVSIGPYLTPPTMGGLPAAIASAFPIAVGIFTTCISSVPELYPYVNKIKLDIKTDSNA